MSGALESNENGYKQKVAPAQVGGGGLEAATQNYFILSLEYVNLLYTEVKLHSDKAKTRVEKGIKLA